ncbi:MAG: zinc-ribbon domain-containing protein, partial [Chloroflexi bacterium]|nr:zinc-ribbon domain-containing protein [Chloroflexota bacterium]
MNVFSKPDPTTAYCPRCGATAPIEVTICPQCGAHLEIRKVRRRPPLADLSLVIVILAVLGFWWRWDDQ